MPILPSLISPSGAVANAHQGRLPVAAAAALLLAASWVYLVYMSWGMKHMDAVADSLLMPAMTGWRGTDLLLVFFMWAIMMLAMMLPSAMPLLLLAAKINYGRFSRNRALLGTGVFALGYLVVWTGFSALATLTQWGLLEARLLSPMMESANPWLSATLLVAAGAYEFTPLKNACLSRCQSPLGFLMTGWREGVSGALIMGLRHGAYCTGCCWLLMTLLFVFGVMNVTWIAALAIFVLLQKLLRQPAWFARATGTTLIAWGALIAMQASLYEVF